MPVAEVIRNPEVQFSSTYTTVSKETANTVQNGNPSSNYLDRAWAVISPYLTWKSNIVALEFQRAIEKGNTVGLRELIKSHPTIHSNPLPNGELPLNYAIRQAQRPCVETMLELGANPLQSDYQELTAFSTAYYKKDFPLVERLFKKQFAQDVEIDKTLQGEESPSNEVIGQMAMITKAQDHVKLCLRSPAIKGISHAISSDAFYTQLDDLVAAKPIQNPQLRTKELGTYLHTAVLLGNDILAKALQNHDLAAMVNEQDKNGMTALHYAAALGRLDSMKMLIQKDAHLKLKDHLSPFSLLAARLNHANPLSITKYDAAIFLAATAFWTAKLLPSNTINIRILQALQAAKFSPLLFTDRANIVSWAFFILAIDGPDWDLLFPWVEAALVANLAYNTFQGIRYCWKNYSLDNRQAILKGIVSYVPRLSICFNQLRNFGESLGLLTKSVPTALQTLTTRDVKCIQSSMPLSNISDKLWECLQNSEQVYNECVDNPQSSSCDNAILVYEKFLQRIEFFNDPKNKRLCIQGTPFKWMDCFAKYNEWKRECSSDFHSMKCLTAEQNFKFATEFRDNSNSGFNWKNTVKECGDAAQELTGNRKSSWEEVNKTYRRKVIEDHPDKGGSEEEMQHLNSLREILKECHENGKL